MKRRRWRLQQQQQQRPAVAILVWFFVAAVVFGAADVDSLRGIVHTHRILVPPFSKGDTPLKAFVVAIIDVDGVQTRIVREAEPNDDVLDYPEEAESTGKGLTRLECESLKRLTMFRVNEPQTTWHLQLVHLLFGDRQDDALRFGVILATQAAENDKWTTLVQNATALSRMCRLRFLSRDEQTYRPRGHYAGLEGGALVSFEAGSQRQQQHNPHWSKALPALLRDATASAKSDTNSNDGFHPMSVTSFVQIPDFASMVKPILNGVIKPLVDPVAGDMVGSLVFQLSASMGMQLEAGITDIIPLMLQREMAQPVNRQIVPAVAETVNDQLPPMVAESIKDYLSLSLKDRVTDAVTERLLVTLTPSITDAVDDQVPKIIDADETRALGHLLTRSLTHAITPAVVHTLSHSPMQDYYCYYCFNKQIYCQYCQYSPTQTFFAEYYASYFSTYYSDYYTEFWASMIEMSEEGAGANLGERYNIQAIGQDINTGVANEFVVRALPLESDTPSFA